MIQQAQAGGLVPAFCGWGDGTPRGTPFAGEVEGDESYFGGRRKGKRGGQVYTKVIPDAKAAMLMPLMQKKIVLDGIVYSDSLPSYRATTCST